MGRARRPSRSGVPRWMIVVSIVLALAAVAAHLAARPGSSGGAEPFVSDAVAVAIADARQRAIDGNVEAAARDLRALAVARGAARGQAGRDAAVLRFEAEAIELLVDVEQDATSGAKVVAGLANSNVADARGGGGPRIYGFEQVAPLVLARLPDGLDDPASPGHRLARAHVLLLFREDARCGTRVAGWVRSRGRRAPEYLPGVLGAFAESGPLAAFHEMPLRRLVADLDRSDTERVLADAAEHAPDLLTRRAAERWLGEVADIPIGLSRTGTADVLMRPAFPEGEIVAAWRSVHDASPVDGLRERLRLAAREHAVAGLESGARTDLPSLHGWIQRRTGLPSSMLPRPRALDVWVAPEVDVVERQLIRVDGERDPVDLVELLSTGMRERAAAHSVLSLVAAADVPRPVWTATDVDDRSIAGRWRSALGIPPEVVALRVSRWTLAGGRWQLVAGSEERADLAEGASVTFEHRRHLDEVAVVSPRLRVPGTPDRRRPDAHFEERLSFGLLRNESGLRLTGSATRRRHAPSGSVASHDGGNLWTVPVTISPTIDVGSTSRPDHLRNELTLVRVADGPDEPRAPEWDDAAWRRALASDLTRLAELAEIADPAWEFHNEHQRTVQNLAAVCMAMRVPEALPALRRLAAVAPGWNAALTEDLLLLAALRAGADDLVDHVRVRAAASEDPELSAVVAGTIGPGPKFWVRLLFDAAHPETRDLAVRTISSQGLSRELADDVRAALASGVLEPVPELAFALAKYPARTSFDVRTATGPEGAAVIAACVIDAALAALIAIALVGLLRRAIWPRVGAILVASGVVASALSVRLLGTELSPPTLAWGAAAVGAWNLRAAVSARAGTVAIIAFAVAAVAALVSPTAEAAAAFAGIVAVTVLGRDLNLAAPPRRSDAPRRPTTAPSRRVALLAVLLALLGAGAVAALRRGGVFMSLGGVTVVVAIAAAIGWTLGIALPTILRSDPTSPRSALPPLFLLLYVAPVVLIQLEPVARLSGMTEGGELPDGVVAGGLTLMSVSVLWSLGRLIDATRTFAAR